MNKNYSIDQAIAIRSEALYFDLHNNYDFIQFNFEVNSKTLNLFFKPSIYASEPYRKLGIVTLQFLGVDYLEISECFVNHISPMLTEIGYKTPNDKDLDWLIGEDKATSKDHMIIRFSNDEYIRLHSLNSIVYCNHPEVAHPPPTARSL